ncbi:MAG: PPOX class F420-dependent oxidoreductase [Mycobacteriaceae bacterium]
MSPLEQLGHEKYLSLTAFRRSGEAVATAVWAVRDDQVLLVTTDGASGKVKRIRHTERVTLTPCDMRGRVADGASHTEARATVITDPAVLDRLEGLIKTKYGLVGRLFALGGRLRRKGARVGLRITMTD